MGIVNKMYFVIFATGFLFSYLCSFIVFSIARKKNFIDKPSKRKVHVRPVPTLGGIAIGLSFFIAMGIAFAVFPALQDEFLLKFFGLFFAGAIILVMGVLDDIYDLNAYLKLLIQVFCALMLIYFGFEIGILTKPFGDGSFSLGGFLSIVITVIWIIGMINAVNLLDGLDGLAAGVIGIAAFFLFIAAVEMQNLAVAVMSLSITAAALGFLPHNFHPAKIFMGNTGSMFLGLMISLIALEGAHKRTAIFTLFIPLFAMAVPIIDTFLSIIRRIIRKKPVFTADKEHIHHKMLVLEKSQTKVVLSLYLLTCCYGLIALSFTGLKGVFAIGALIIVLLATLRWLRNWGFLKF
ncbi:MAG: undecaprenyl/decaprenyl-phosphate alpha-N-acetylglucosaminyl 1-phosphate transferase [Candidatus Omnitrophica bacterium]|nr:undecaprenyl/decaprenyl-phosphate alpha-N-acetylglucosaminyl 1-phosphate transferase [Candidatus Omnitrophota bacterium]